MEQIIEEYGIGGILFVIGTGVLARWDSFCCPDRD